MSTIRVEGTEFELGCCDGEKLQAGDHLSLTGHGGRSLGSWLVVRREAVAHVDLSRSTTITFVVVTPRSDEAKRIMEEM